MEVALYIDTRMEVALYIDTRMEVALYVDTRMEVVVSLVLLLSLPRHLEVFRVAYVSV